MSGGRQGHRGVLEGADMSYFDLSGRDLSGIKLTRAKLVGAKLTGTLLVLADLWSADFIAADLSGAALLSAPFDNANCTRAKLAPAMARWTAILDASATGTDLRLITVLDTTSR